MLAPLVRRSRPVNKIVALLYKFRLDAAPATTAVTLRRLLRLLAGLGRNPERRSGHA